MANAFKRNSVTADTTAVQVLTEYSGNASPDEAYAVPTSTPTEVVVIGLLASNKTTATHYITVEIVDVTTPASPITTTWIKNAPIPAGSSLSMMENKLVLKGDDKLQVTADAASAIDVTLSFLEIT